MRDSYDRELRYLRLSVTERCNFACEYCSPGGGCSSGARSELPLESLGRIAATAVRLGFAKIRVTGGEPLLREGLIGFVAGLARLPGLESLAMTSNGSLLSPLARDLADAGLKSVNITLVSLDPGEFGRVTGGGRLETTLSGVEAALRASLEVKLNIVVDAADPSGEARASLVEGYARSVGASSQRIRRYDPGAPKVHDERFDRPPPCASCDRLRLLSDGRMLACLHSAVFVDIDPGRPEEGIRACASLKPASGARAAAASLREIGG